MKPWLLSMLMLLAWASSAPALEFAPKNIYQEASKAVVLVTAFNRGEGYQSVGSGAVIRDDGLVITNAHVIYSETRHRPYDQLQIYLKPERVTGDLKNDTSRKYRAVILNYSVALDLAVLKIELPHAAAPFNFLKFADSESFDIGEPVLAIGHPEQGGLWTLTTGTISSKIENFQNVRGKNVFQTEASINRGNSGGPLIDRHGHIVGINSNISRESKDGLAITGINFSIKSGVAVRWLNTMGYPFFFAVPEFGKEEKLPDSQNAGIVPAPKSKESEATKPVDPPPAKPEILTEARPYKVKDLFTHVEKEMEGMMEEMKGKLKKNERPPVSGDRN